MRKRLLLIIIILALAGGAFSFFYVRKESLFSGKVARSANKGELSGTERERIISENMAKYQPKSGSKEIEGPVVTAKSAIVVDQNTNTILYSKNMHEALPPASIIKMLTFSMALEKFEENELIEISENASVQVSNKINMKPGEKMKLSDLLYGLMMISANDAAYAIADASDDGFEGFIKAANDKVEMLGLKETVMKNPAGLDEEGQTSSAYDLATITRYALLEHPQIIKYAGKTAEHSVYATEANEPHYWFGHLSRMLTAYKPMIAAKTGYTDLAGSTYIGIAEKNGRRLILVILGDKNSAINNDVTSLLDYGFSLQPSSS